MEEPDLERISALLESVLEISRDDHPELLRQSIPEWDSLKHMELVFALEDQYGICFDESEFAGLISAETILAAVRRHLAP